jgi:hypothetical protein
MYFGALFFDKYASYYSACPVSRHKNIIYEKFIITCQDVLLMFFRCLLLPWLGSHILVIAASFALGKYIQ